MQRLRDPGDDAAPPSRARGRWLASTAGAEALEEALESHELDATEADWLKRQRNAVRHALEALPAQARLRRVLAQARLASDEPLDLRAQLARLSRSDDVAACGRLARELEHALRPIALEHVAAHMRAEEPWLEAPVPRSQTAGQAPARVASSGLLIVSAYSIEAMAQPATRDLPAAPWLADAEAFLSQTDGAADDALRRCLRAFRPGKLIDWQLVLRGLRAPELDSSQGAARRWQRAAAWLGALGFERELQARVRAEPDRGALLPVATLLPLAPPRDVRVAQSTIDHGVSSDVLAAEGVGRALGLALVHPALPAELRWPVGASGAGALGGLALQLAADREQLMRVHEMGAAEAERVARAAGTLALLFTRVWVALALVKAGAAEDARSRLEQIAGAVGRALCCDLPPGIAGLLAADRVLSRQRAPEALAGFALHVGLRERYDADFYRNPRSEEFLRAGCERGNGVQPDALCAEAGASLGAAATRAIELVT